MEQQTQRRTLPDLVLCLVTDRNLFTNERMLVEAVEKAVAGGVNMVQLREKDMPHDELTELAVRLRRVTAGKALLIVNSDIQAATEAGADGVQLPEEESAGVRPGDSRPSPHGLTGRSVHSAAAAAQAEATGADFVVFGTIFPSRSHPGGSTKGLDGLQDAVSATTLPVIGIGGIDQSNADDVMNAGASGIAVISAILAARDPESAAAGLWRLLRSSCEAGRRFGNRR